MKQSSDERLSNNDMQEVSLLQSPVTRRQWLTFVSNVATAAFLPPSTSPLGALLSNDLSLLSNEELLEKLDAVVALDPDNLWSSICFHICKYPFSAELTRISADDTDQMEDGIWHSDLQFFSESPLLVEGIEAIGEINRKSLGQDLVNFVMGNWHQRMPENINNILAIGEVARKNLASHHALLEPIYEECERRRASPNRDFWFNFSQDDRHSLFRIEREYCSPTQMQKAIDQLRRYAEHVASGTISEYIKGLPPEQQVAVQELLPETYISGPEEEVQLKKQYRDSLQNLLLEHGAIVTRHATAEMLMYIITHVNFENQLFYLSSMGDIQEIPDPRIGQLVQKIDPGSRHIDYASGLYADLFAADEYKYPFPLEREIPSFGIQKVIGPAILIIEPDGMLQELLERFVTPH